MATKISLMSAAFSLLGRGTITSVGPGAEETVLACSALYDELYSSLFTDYYWRFTLRLLLLPAVVNPPPYQALQYAYQLPPANSIVRILNLEPPGIYYQIFGDLVYATTAVPPSLVYNCVPQEGELPPSVVKYLVFELAGLFAMPVTQRVEIAQLWSAPAAKAKIVAMQVDSQNQPAVGFTNSPIAQAKFNNTPISY